ncbi:DUF4465 domain-containing protein [Crocinitomicaceae bacterium]|nr:DUF4465 domain-containing protein [Crocinitomicaceae bacterium]
MKKLYVLATAFMIGASAQAQIIDFENFLPTADTFDNGWAGNGDFILDDVRFYNNYDATWGSWTGFSISNKTDVVTPGWGNQFSAWTGSGHNASESYAVFYSSGSISVDQENISLDQFKITNTTYSALSMRDGDGFGKQFGSIYNGDSTVVDGTNGEDFYRVWVYGKSHDGSMVDSVEIYLADYRFADNSQDYIVDSWIDVDLTGFLFIIGELSFKIESSDTTGGWINTPTYFTIDGLNRTTYGGINEQQLSNISIFPNPVKDFVNINGESGHLMITSLSGEILLEAVHEQSTSVNLSEFPSGVYIVHLENVNGSFKSKVVKN